MGSTVTKSVRTPRSVNSKKLARHIIALHIYGVCEGRAFKRVYLKGELCGLDRIKVKGYISGVVVSSNEDVNATIDGHAMGTVDNEDSEDFFWERLSEVEGKDVSYLYNSYYGSSVMDEANSETDLPPRTYFYFPQISWDSVSPKPEFEIDLATGDAALSLHVEQDGYNTICILSSDPERPNKKIVFRYVGTELKDLLKTPGLQQRLSRIAGGIASVERAFRLDLIREVNIMDYRGVNNALTCEGTNSIWFYRNTFVGEPLDELDSIAVHETLHKFVETERFTYCTQVRQFFADLHGYGELSRERFILVVKGISPPPQAGSDEDAPQLFFDFIDERNFLRGMKGGHSGDNLDEFCTSLLHSLLYFDRLENNLRLPLNLGCSNRCELLTRGEKRIILRDYVRAIDSLLSARHSHSPAGRDSINTFLMKRLTSARTVLEKISSGKAV